jgi:environmental stress-induced protein Ves
MTTHVHEWRLVDLGKVAPQPWRNGGGVTRELLVWPSGQVWKARVSVADVAAAGPFSAFPGIERWFAVLDGDGLGLRAGAGLQHLTTDSPALRFSGDMQVDCSLLGGPTRDLNLMTEPGKGRLVRVPGEFTFQASGESIIAVYAHAQPARIVTLEQEIEIPPRHLAWQHRNWRAHGTVVGTDALWMEIRT